MKDETPPAFAVANGNTAGVRDGIDTSEFEQEAHHSSLNFNDVLYILFRHKWKISLCAATGIVAAAALYLLSPPIYQSEAKLFVRYVVDKSVVDGIDSQVKTPNPLTDTLINSEVEILTSSDLAPQAAEAVGIERLAPDSGAKATIDKAAQNVLHGLDVSIVKGTNIISVSFKSTDAKL